jgi:NAD(P)H-dependent FMN reductase
MTTIVGFAGSLRSGSYNAALLREAQRAAPQRDELQIVSIADIPLYNYDVEVSAYPPAVSALKDRIVRADGLLIATPEYNNSIPGVAKNVVDWLSRPPDDGDRVFKDLPVAVMGTSPGRFGTVLAQNAWLPVFRTLEMMPYFEGRLVIPQAAKVFDDHLNLADDVVRGLLRQFVHGFFAFAAQHTRRARA